MLRCNPVEQGYWGREFAVVIGIKCLAGRNTASNGCNVGCGCVPGSTAEAKAAHCRQASLDSERPPKDSRQTRTWSSKPRRAASCKAGHARRERLCSKNCSGEARGDLSEGLGGRPRHRGAGRRPQLEHVHAGCKTLSPNTSPEQREFAMSSDKATGPQVSAACGTGDDDLRFGWLQLEPNQPRPGL